MHNFYTIGAFLNLKIFPSMFGFSRPSIFPGLTKGFFQLFRWPSESSGLILLQFLRHFEFFVFQRIHSRHLTKDQCPRSHLVAELLRLGLRIPQPSITNIMGYHFILN